MSLEKHINKILDLKINEPIKISDTQTGIYANKKWVDEISKRVIVYYYDSEYRPDSRKLPDFIRVKGREFDIEYWREERPRIATEQEKKEMYERVKKKKQ
ncbi:MAG: hypothetical protein KatS3mg002_0496 [Candidatus Woesearchaeota archaeon]|nr:MAG: hypothetical protein KatS3mg002_0496 [Candidatus Woesearchaeota archaeon]